MPKKPPAKTSQVLEHPPIEFDYCKIQRFWLYRSDEETMEIWYNPPRRKLADLPTKYIGHAFYRPKVKKWGAFVRFNKKKPMRFIGMFEDDEEIGQHLFEHVEKLKK